MQQVVLNPKGTPGLSHSACLQVDDAARISIYSNPPIGRQLGHLYKYFRGLTYLLEKEVEHATNKPWTYHASEGANLLSPHADWK